jgi:hypothetical protein
MTDNPQAKDNYEAAGSPYARVNYEASKNPHAGDSYDTTDATAALAEDPRTAADTVAGAPGRASGGPPAVTAADFGPLSPEGAEEIGTVLQMIKTLDCTLVSKGQNANGEFILEEVCKERNDRSPFLDLWLTDILVNQRTRTHWINNGDSRYDAALQRAERASEKLRLKTAKAIDAMDAASAQPYSDQKKKKPILSQKTMNVCRELAETLRSRARSDVTHFVQLLDALASGLAQPLDELDLLQAERELHELIRQHEGSRRYIYGTAVDEAAAAKAAGRGADAFLWKAIAEGTAPGHREPY